MNMHGGSLSLTSDQTSQETPRACTCDPTPMLGAAARPDPPSAPDGTVRGRGGLRAGAGVDADRPRPAPAGFRGAVPQAQAHRPAGGQRAFAARGGCGLRRAMPGAAGRSHGGGDRRGLVGPEGGPVAAPVARIAAGGRACADPVRGGAPAGEAQQPPGAHPLPAPARAAVAAGAGADHCRRCRLSGAVLPGGGAPRLALGGTGARARLCAPGQALGELQERVPSGHEHAARAGHGRVGAQQSAAGAVRAGQAAAAGAPRQDCRRQAGALEKGQQGRTQRQGAVAVGRLPNTCRPRRQAAGGSVSTADADRDRPVMLPP